MMSRLSASSAPLFAILLATLPLAGCQTAPNAANLNPPIVDESPYNGLEKRVETLEGQMRSAQPTLKKVEAIESHFKALSFELDKISETYKTETVVPPVVTSVPVVEKQKVEAPAAKVEAQPQQKPVAQVAEPIKAEPEKEAVNKNVFSVTSVRVGEQTKNITRIVLDTTQPAEIHYDLDNTEGLLVIDVPKAKWSATAAQTLSKSPMVKSFRAVDDESGSKFVAELKQKAKVVTTARLSPSGTSGNRVYIDLAPAN